MAVILNVAVGGDIIEMLGGGKLGGPFAGQVNVCGFQQLDKAVEPIGGDKGVDRVRKQQELRLLNGIKGLGKVLFKLFYLSAHMEHIKRMRPVQLFKIAHRLQGDAVVSLWSAVQNQNIHRFPPAFFFIIAHFPA